MYSAVVHRYAWRSRRHQRSGRTIEQLLERERLSRSAASLPPPSRRATARSPWGVCGGVRVVIAAAGLWRRIGDKLAALEELFDRVRRHCTDGALNARHIGGRQQAALDSRLAQQPATALAQGFIVSFVWRIQGDAVDARHHCGGLGQAGNLRLLISGGRVRAHRGRQCLVGHGLLRVRILGRRCVTALGGAASAAPASTSAHGVILCVCEKSAATTVLGLHVARRQVQAARAHHLVRTQHIGQRAETAPHAPGA